MGYNSHGDIYRTYLGTKINVTKGTNDVYENLLNHIKNNVAKKYKNNTQKEQAKILTQFFNEIKKTKNLLQKSEIATFIQNSGNSKLWDVLLQIDFSVGGANFERELNKIIDPQNLGEKIIGKSNKTVGDALAGVKWDISGYGNNNIDIQDFLKKIKLNLRKDVEDSFKDKLRILQQESGPIITWSTRRQGKIDVMGTEDLIAFYNLEGSPNSIFKQGLDILSTAKISVKSYETIDSQIHLGDTDPIKAYMSIVSMFGKTKSSILSPSFFIAHKEGYTANSEGKKGESQEKVEFTYNRYHRAIDAYELAGYGLQYSILNDILNEGADFLLINRTGNSNTVVLSTLDILNEFFNQFEKGDSKTVSIETIIARLERNS